MSVGGGAASKVAPARRLPRRPPEGGGVEVDIGGFGFEVPQFEAFAETGSLCYRSLAGHL
jgi:hypothetical protein